jgi:hypothetical protein
LPMRQMVARNESETNRLPRSSNARPFGNPAGSSAAIHSLAPSGGIRQTPCVAGSNEASAA